MHGQTINEAFHDKRNRAIQFEGEEKRQPAYRRPAPGPVVYRPTQPVHGATRLVFAIERAIGRVGPLKERHARRQPRLSSDPSPGMQRTQQMKERGFYQKRKGWFTKGH